MWPRPTGTPGTRAALTARMFAQAPRALALLAAGVLIALGIRGLVAQPGGAAIVIPSPMGSDASLSQRAVAEAFARSYLGGDPRHPGRRVSALGSDLVDEQGDGAGVSPPRGGRLARILSTAVAADEARPRGGRLITVATQTSGGLVYLAVPVAADPSGAAVVTAQPAIVGPPHGAPGPPVALAEPVEDPALAAVARRSLGNYLAGDRGNLLADLAPGAVVSLPEPMHAIRVGEVTWVDPSRGLVAVAVAASLKGGARAELRYEVGLASQGARWAVSGIGTP